MLATPRAVNNSREKSQSWSDVRNMAPNETKMASPSKSSTPRGSTQGKKGLTNGHSLASKGTSSGDGSKRRSSSTERKGAGLCREKMTNGLSSNSKISINVIEDNDSDNDSEERDNVFSPIGDKPLISILKMPGRNRARSQSLPPNMILQQLTEGVAALGPNSKLAGLLSRESSEEGSIESLVLPSYVYSQRKVSFSLPHDPDDTGSRCSTPSQLLPPLSGRLSPSLVSAEQGGGSPRKHPPVPFDNGSSESLDGEHRRSPVTNTTRPSTVTCLLPTGSSIFQKAMAAEISDSSDRNSDSSDMENEKYGDDRSRSKTNKRINRTTKPRTNSGYLSPEYSVPMMPSPRILNNYAGLSSRRSGQSGLSPRRQGPASGLSPRRQSKSDVTESRRT